MTAQIFTSPAARRDLVETYVYRAENAGQKAADRFLSSAEASFCALSENPEIGALLKLRRPELAGLRKWPVKGFENILIFYLPHPKGILIVRVLDAAQDWWGLLGIET